MASEFGFSLRPAAIVDRSHRIMYSATSLRLSGYRKTHRHESILSSASIGHDCDDSMHMQVRYGAPPRSCTMIRLLTLVQ